MTTSPNPDGDVILTINGGSSSIKFAQFEVGDSLRRTLHGSLENMGQPHARLRAEGMSAADSVRVDEIASRPEDAVAFLVDWISQQLDTTRLRAIGHRVVHGGHVYRKPVRVTRTVLDVLRQLAPCDPDHLPGEIRLIEALMRRFPGTAQVACFDTAFHHGMPRVAQLLPIPRRYETQGVRRYGFHGLSYEFLMDELTRLAGTDVAQGRVILAHLGSGASLAAVHRGRSLDTSMGFTPASGLVMGTRSGDLDPGLVGYLGRTENMSVQAFDAMVNHRSGLLGLSETSSDIRELLATET
ncbi:MAG: hypothetical protein ABI411_20350, partial [Tahibacter sp.]